MKRKEQTTRRVREKDSERRRRQERGGGRRGQGERDREGGRWETVREGEKGRKGARQR